MIKTIKVIALKPFDNGNGLVNKGSVIDIPTELLNHFTKHGKVAIEAKIEKAKVDEVKEVKKTKRKRK